MPPRLTLPPWPVEQYHALVDQALALPRAAKTIGARLATLSQHLLDNDVIDRSIVVLAGGGRRGAAAVAAAVDLLAGEGWVQVLLASPRDQLSPEMITQLDRLAAADASPAWAEEGWELPPADLIIDAVAGDAYALDRAALDLIQLANSSVAPIVSVGAPSGVDLHGGLLARAYVRAEATLLLAPPPLLHDDARPACGRLYLADVGLSRAAFEEMGVNYPFMKSDLVEVQVGS